jgi:hypothetical protein
MKKFLVLILATFALNVYAEAEMKKVCHEKNGKQVCKTIKTHKKLDGDTKVPEKKKK